MHYTLTSIYHTLGSSPESLRRSSESTKAADCATRVQVNPDPHSSARLFSTRLHQVDSLARLFSLKLGVPGFHVVFGFVADARCRKKKQELNQRLKRMQYGPVMVIDSSNAACVPAVFGQIGSNYQPGNRQMLRLQMTHAADALTAPCPLT